MTDKPTPAQTEGDLFFTEWKNKRPDLWRITLENIKKYMEKVENE